MISNLHNLLARRDLVTELVRSELKATTHKTRLGWLWWLADPLVMIGIYWLFIVIIFGRDRYAPYPIFIGCALLAWKHLSASSSQATRTIRSRQALIKAVPFPTIVLPISLTLTQLMYFTFGFTALLVVAALIGQPMTLTLLQIPPLVVMQTMLVGGVVLCLACFGALVRDLEAFVTHIMRVGWYLSPGIYGVDLVATRFKALENVPGDLLIQIYMLNPFAIIFTGYRGAIHEPAWLAWHHWLVLATQSVAALLIGYAVYRFYDRRVLKFV